MDRYYNKFVRDMGIPIIIGEMGAMNKNDNHTARTAWAKFYTSEARKRGMPCFWWDNAVTTGTGERFGLLNRTNSTFPAAILPVVEALMEGAGVTDL
jgi:endoglucanase